MGTKNRIFLGVLTYSILHKIRNKFISKKIFINDKVFKKIKNKHFDVVAYINEEKFLIVLENTICIYFDEDENIYNCLSKIEGKFIIYGIVPKNIRNDVTTLFYTNIKQIKKKFPNDENLRILKKEEYTIN